MRSASWALGGAVAAIACAGAISAAPTAGADQIGYLVNVTVKPGYNFPNADAALGYGYSLCDRIRAGEAYPALAASIRQNFRTDEYGASYLLSQATQELCPAQIWALRQSAGGYRPQP
ncbi:DUF732 domain-containing protein [Mycolicibacterium mengxianglii]|uniref:DUF732 domain-containing protein n=1 Tax=Mycolicibacterium mengxianglii TaxID=2736649 RepID=UPI0018D00B7B|nr:DUF732 domain-containing protein [Mycolicibacterium mengxianglii]